MTAEWKTKCGELDDSKCQSEAKYPDGGEGKCELEKLEEKQGLVGPSSVSKAECVSALVQQSLCNMVVLAEEGNSMEELNQYVKQQLRCARRSIHSAS